MLYNNASVFLAGADGVVTELDEETWTRILAINLNSGTLMLAGSTGNELHLISLSREENLFTGEVSVSEERINLPQIGEPISQLILDPRQMWLYVFNGSSSADVFDLRKRSLA